ncbi:MAG: radical SAM protein [Methylococcales bacterium]
MQLASAELLRSISSGIRYSLEDHPFSTVYVDVTHRCNMECRNCYLPNRDLPDLDMRWLDGALKRMHKRVEVRLIGGEPTVRTDLLDIIRKVRSAGHRPMLVSNGLKLASPGYLRQLKQAGLRSVYISMNGGLDDDLYQAIDDMRCANRKRLAFEMACAERFTVSIGYIIVPGVNVSHLREFAQYLKPFPGVRGLKLRSIGQVGRYMEGTALSLDDLRQIAADATGTPLANIPVQDETESETSFLWGTLRVQMTRWPDIGNHTRGRLTPEGFVEPMSEHVMSNEGGY